MRVLVVDDSPETLASVEMVLASAGYETETCLSAAAAIEAHRAKQADVLITDLFMPEVDGIETILEFRSQWPGIKIVAMTGGGDWSARFDDEFSRFKDRLDRYLSVAKKAPGDP